jgi:hypothetical protein
MSIEWIFDKAGANMTKHRDMEEGIVQATSKMTRLEILARENEQNIVDHPADPTKPSECTYEVRTLTGTDKDDFYSNLQMNDFTPHLKGAIAPPIAALPSATNLNADLTEDLNLLIIRHDNGVGLLGGEFMDEETDKRNFEALVKSYGLNEKGPDGGGGSHGVGKNVYWQWSKHGMVLFYSSMNEPYDDKGEFCAAGKGSTCGHTRRFIGTGRVKVAHKVGDTTYMPYGLLGIKVEHGGVDASVSLYDDFADNMATELGLKVRDAANPGTTIVIVGFRDPLDPTKDMVKEAMEAVGLQMSSEKSWFPAKLSGALEVSYVDSSGLIDWTPQGGKSYRLLEWLEKGLDEEAGNKETVVHGKPKCPTTLKRVELDLEIPTHYPKNTTGGILHSKAVLALMIVDDEEFTGDNPELGVDEWGNTACIRHSGMVVTYKPFIQRPSKYYRAVLLVGNSVARFDKKSRTSLDPLAQTLAEEMMKFSEPAVHDDWQPKNFSAYVAGNGSLSAAYKRVADIGETKISTFLKTVEHATREALGLLAPPKAKKNADWAELSKELDFGSSNSDSGGRIIKITSAKVVKTESDKATLSFNVDVPGSGTANGWNSRTTHWWLKIKPKLRWPNGKKQTPPTDIICLDFENLLDDANNSIWRELAKVNYSAAKAKWKKRKSDPLAIAMKINDWEGSANNLEKAEVLGKNFSLSFKNIEIDLTGYENATLELSIEAGEVRS